MPIEYRIDRDAGIIEETWTGTVAIQDLRDYWRGYLADPDVLALRRTVVDLRAADITFTGAELGALVRSMVLPVLGNRHWVTALVVSQLVQFGVGRQYQMFAESYSRDAIFSDVEAAKEWLGTQPAEV
jgi:hypothetical protein